MSFATVSRDIQQRLVDNWASTEIDIDENVPFNPTNETEWIKLRIFDESTQRINIGMPGIHRNNGTIIVEIYTPLNRGTRTGRAYADSIADIFRDKQFNGITCRSASISVPGEKEGWWMTVVSVPFYWDGTYSA